MKYPEYVKNYRPKGTVVKKVGDVYYVYKATSKRVPGKKYPVQIVEGLVGKIDAFGFHPATTAKVDIENVIVRECGFTNYLLRYEKSYINENCALGIANTKTIYRSMIAYLSPNTYLYDDKDSIIRPVNELVEMYGIGVPNRIISIQKHIGVDLSQLEPLKYICNVRLGKKVFNSTLTNRQKQILEELGIDERDIR